LPSPDPPYTNVGVRLAGDRNRHGRACANGWDDPMTKSRTCTSGEPVAALAGLAPSFPVVSRRDCRVGEAPVGPSSGRRHDRPGRSRAGRLSARGRVGFGRIPRPQAGPADAGEAGLVRGTYGDRGTVGTVSACGAVLGRANGHEEPGSWRRTPQVAGERSVDGLAKLGLDHLAVNGSRDRPAGAAGCRRRRPAAGSRR